MGTGRPYRRGVSAPGGAHQAVSVKPAPSREDGTTLPVLLARDADRVPQEWRARKVFLRSHEVPVQYYKVVSSWRNFEGVPVALNESIAYDLLAGASWRSRT